MKFKDLLNLSDHYLYVQDIKEYGQNTLELIILSDSSPISSTEC